ncbi:hypothetical protein [Bacillus solitudinis]|uniref:hypothetical protein n=1 Tax=Bacillus solitudinis TaxID=2014074 RepID=UPI000C2420C4|nr:hypothetical protein [Bacillus solitudinis]
MIFNKKNYPFIILVLIHLAMLGFIFLKKDNRKSYLLLLLSNTALAYLFEYIVLNLFNMYTYYPKFLKHQYINNVFGAILSQAIIIPITATFITAIKIKWKGKMAFSFYFFIIEKIFIKKHIFKLQTWKSHYTFLLTLLYFYISDGWFKGRHSFILQRITKFFVYLVIHANSLYGFAIKDLYRFRLKTGTWREHFIISPIYSIIVSLLFTINHYKLNKRLTGFLIALTYVLDQTLARFGILHFRKYVFLPLHITILLFPYIVLEEEKS